MPDITMCGGEGCPLASRCYRATAQPSPCLQSYFLNPPWDGEKCAYFWNTEPVICELCGQPRKSALDYVHGHIHCLTCGKNVGECCDGERGE